MAHQAKSIVAVVAILLCAAPMSFAQQRTGAQQGTNVVPGATQQQRQIQTLATVNGQEVTRQQVSDQCMRRFGEDVLESIINKMLVFSACQQNGINITEKDVNDDIINKAKTFGMSGERYVKLICSRRNITEDRLKNDIVWNELALRRLAESQIQVTPEELNQRMEFEFGAKVQVREIAVKSQAKAQQIQQAATNDPATFERLAKENSVNPNSAAMGGLLQPIRRNAGLPAYENVAFGLQPGEVSQVFQIEDTFFILKCLRHFPKVELGAEQLAMAHERLMEEISNEKLRNSAADLFVRMQSNAKIVNVLNDPKLSQQMPGVAAIVNNQKILKNQVGEECITRFGMMMLESEIENKLLEQALRQKEMVVSPEDLNTEIERKARQLGHVNPDGSVNIDEWLAFVTANDPDKIDFYLEDEVKKAVSLRKLVEDQVAVSDEDMQKGFEANFGERVEALVIVSTDQRQALKVWNMASANPTAQYFGQLAHQYSVEPASKNNHGVAPPIQKHGGRPELEKEAFSLKPNEISKVVQVGEYWVILYCRGRTTPTVTRFEDVQEELYKNIFEKKMDMAMGEYFERLRTESQIDNYLTGTSQPGKAFMKQARETKFQGDVPPRNQFR